MTENHMERQVRIAVYTIARNEAGHVARFMESVVDEADVVLVLDTGSSDGTVDLLRGAGAAVLEASISPFRFDMARNTALALVPEDIDVCVSLDLDEVLTPGWRTALEACWREGATRVRYPYTWNWTPDGEPSTVFHTDKIHARHGYRWRNPVHENLETMPGLEERIVTCEGFTVEHHADPAKSRGGYLALLEMSVAEDPADDRSSHYLAREYSFHCRWDDVLREGERHLALPSATWNKERAKTMRLLAQACRRKGEPERARTFLHRAVAEDPMARENYLDLAELCLAEDDHAGARAFGHHALALTRREMSYIVDEAAWTWKPHDILAVAAHYLGNVDESLTHARRAIEMNPHDVRLRQNLRMIVEAALARQNGK